MGVAKREYSCIYIYAFLIVGVDFQPAIFLSHMAALGK